ncbi:class I SAM-dependent methyltransferase [Streptomyces sp. NPDC056500]|uniref:class I SAM-dependent methyltransferase n=1 Tax=Streptomyces sp. NPDC056500 TaxID=3345840 RepID=UPI003674F9B2
MPTMEPEPTPGIEPAPHQHPRTAGSFGADAERYDRTRPGYPAAMVERIVAALPESPQVLDVGCGTGIAARQFQEAGCRVLGVDVDARMTDLAGRRGLRVEVAAFESWDPAGREFDAVVSGQSWHWVDPVAGAAKAGQALRPGGLFAVFWNAGRPPVELVRCFAESYRRVAPESLAARFWARPAEGAYAKLCAKATDGVRGAGVFGPAEQWRFDGERSYTRDEWLSQLPTTGAHVQLPPALASQAAAEIGAAIDAAGGGFTMRYVTLAVAAVRSATG